MKIIRNMNYFIIVLIICTALMPAVSAHRVIIKEQISEIQIKAYYGGGGADPMAYADVEIYYNKTGEEKLYLNGKTDEDGMYYFTPELGASEYRVVVSATGHEDDYEFSLTQGAQQEEAELPLYMQILTGFGLLFGLGGAAMYINARKIQKEYENKEEK